MLALIEKGGEFVSNDIWHRVVQVIMEQPSLQPHCCTRVVGLLTRPDVATYDEPFLKCAAYIVGEWGHTLQATPSGPNASALFALLLPLLGGASAAAKALMLTAAAKLAMHAPNDAALRARVRKLFVQHQALVDEELQQRAVEYLAITERTPPPAALKEVLAPMPAFPTRASALERSLADSPTVALPLPAAAAARPATEPSEVIHMIDPPTANGVQARSTSGTASPPITTLDDLLLGTPPHQAAHGGARATVAAAAGAAQPDLLCDLLGLEVGPPATATGAGGAASAGAGGAGVAGDPFGGVDLLAPVAAAAAVTEVQPTPLGDLNEWFDRLCLTDTGVLYEDQFLQARSHRPPTVCRSPILSGQTSCRFFSCFDTVAVAIDQRGTPRRSAEWSGSVRGGFPAQVGLKAMYRGAAGRVVLYLGNKTDTQPIEGLSVPISPIQGLRANVNNALPPSLSPKQQVQLVVDVACEQPYLKSPILQLAYHLRGSSVRVRQVSLSLSWAPSAAATHPAGKEAHTCSGGRGRSVVAACTVAAASHLWAAYSRRSDATRCVVCRLSGCVGLASAGTGGAARGSSSGSAAQRPARSKPDSWAVDERPPSFVLRGAVSPPPLRADAPTGHGSGRRGLHVACLHACD
jgi:hypothetical protein